MDELAATTSGGGGGRRRRRFGWATVILTGLGALVVGIAVGAAGGSSDETKAVAQVRTVVSTVTAAPDESELNAGCADFHKVG